MDFPISTPRPMPRRPPVRSVQVMSTATRDHPSGSLRVSDADRDRAIAELSEHYQAGRLTTEELEDRTGRALQARTTADLAALFTDLPRRQAPVTGAASAPASAPSAAPGAAGTARSEEHTSELQSRLHLVCRLLLEKKKKTSSRSHCRHASTG